MQGLGVHAWNGDVQLLQAARCVTRRSMVIDRGMVGDASKSGLGGQRKLELRRGQRGICEGRQCGVWALDQSEVKRGTNP